MAVRRSIYLDNQATTRTDPRVVKAMLPYFDADYGNPSSGSHVYGWRAEEALELARERVAEGIGALDAREVIFTSGATESNNLALQGVIRAYASQGDHVIAQATEHPSVLAVLEALGTRVTILPVDRAGLVDPDALSKAITDRTVLASIMLANNEIGVIQPVAELAAICRERGVLFHCDAAQAVGKIPVDVEALKVDLLSFSGHKIYGPKGVGALYVADRRPRIKLEPLLYGGTQERGLRAGTVAVPLAVGLAEALSLCVDELEEEAKRVRGLRDALWLKISGELWGVEMNGDAVRRLPGNLNLLFEGLESEKLLIALRGFALSSGSACSSGSGEPSHVLLALGRSPAQARASLRFGLGRFNTVEQVQSAGRAVVEAVAGMRGG